MKTRWIILAFLGASPFEAFGGETELQMMEQAEEEAPVKEREEDPKEDLEELIRSSLRKIPNFSPTNTARALKSTRIALLDAAFRACQDGEGAHAKYLIDLSKEDDAKKILNAFRFIQDHKGRLNERGLNAPYHMVKDDASSDTISQAASTLSDLEAEELEDSIPQDGKIAALRFNEHAGEDFKRELKGAWVTLKRRGPDFLMEELARLGLALL